MSPLRSDLCPIVVAGRFRYLIALKLATSRGTHSQRECLLGARAGEHRDGQGPAGWISAPRAEGTTLSAARRSLDGDLFWLTSE